MRLENLIATLVLMFLAVGLYFTLVGALNLPVVALSTSENRPVACYSQESDWARKPVSDRSCQDVLAKGHYDTQWEK